MKKEELVNKVHAQMLADKARLALESALPRNVSYVVLLSGPDFGTYASNLDKYQSLLALRELVKALEADCVRGGG